MEVELAEYGLSRKIRESSLYSIISQYRLTARKAIDNNSMENTELRKRK